MSDPRMSRADRLAADRALTRAWALGRWNPRKWER